MRSLSHAGGPPCRRCATGVRASGPECWRRWGTQPLRSAGTVSAPSGANDGERCGAGEVVVIAAAAPWDNGGAAIGVLSLYVTCAARESAPPSVLDQLAVTTGPAGVYRVTAYTRSVAAPPASTTLAAALGLAPNATLAPALGSCAQAAGARAAEYVAADVQCQGVPHDRCACVDGGVRCVAAGAGQTVTLPAFVAEKDLAIPAGGVAAAPMPWCEDGDIVDGWMLLQVRAQHLHMRICAA
jgi:hypothetical protein